MGFFRTHWALLGEPEPEAQTASPPPPPHEHPPVEAHEPPAAA